MKVLIDTPSFFISKRNTDWVYMKNYKLLNQFVTSDIVYNKSSIFSLVASSDYILKRFNLSGSWFWQESRRVDGLKLQRKGVDVILNHSIPPLVYNSRIPIIWIWELIDTHMLRANGYKNEKISLLRKHGEHLMDRATVVKTATYAACNRNKKLFPEHQDKFYACPFFLPHISPLSIGEIESKYKTNKIKICFVGGQGYRKGLDLVVAAINKLPSSLQSKMSLTVISRESCGIEKLKVNYSFHKVLKYKDIEEIMRASHIFIMPSRLETYGFTLLEAMAAGCAVIGPQWESQKEILDYGRAGINCSPDELSVYKALIRLLEDSKYRRDIALSGHQRYTESYAPSVVAQTYKDMMEFASSSVQ